MTTTIADIDALAAKYGLAPQDLAALLRETDAVRNLLTPGEAQQGLANVVAIYIQSLGAAAERFVDPAERHIADRVVALTIETLAAQLSAAPQRPN